MLVEKTLERVKALESLKHLLCNAPCLRYPDFEKPFFLYTDASKHENRMVGINCSWASFFVVSSVGEIFYFCI